MIFNKIRHSVKLYAKICKALNHKRKKCGGVAQPVRAWDS